MKRIRILFMVLFCLNLVMSIDFISRATELEKAHIVIESYEIENDFISAGSEAEIKLVIKNVSKLTAKNVVLSTMNNQGLVFPVIGESNQKFIGDIKPQSSCEMVIPVRITEGNIIPSSVHDAVLQFVFSFSDENASDRTEQAYISVPIVKDCNMEISKIYFPSEWYVGENTIISTEIENCGTVVAEDIKLHIVLANGEEFIYDIGDMQSGVVKIFDHTIYNLQTGIQNVIAYLSYSDEIDNNFTTQRVVYEINILEEKIDKVDLENYDNNNYIKEYFVNCILLLIAVVIIFVFHKRDTRRIDSGKEVSYGE